MKLKFKLSNRKQAVKKLHAKFTAACAKSAARVGAAVTGHTLLGDRLTLLPPGAFAWHSLDVRHPIQNASRWVE